MHSDHPPSDQSLTPAAIAQLIQHAIQQTTTLKDGETGWKAVKLQQAQTLLTAALEAVQIVSEADPEWDDPAWEALLQAATALGAQYSTEP